MNPNEQRLDKWLEQFQRTETAYGMLKDCFQATPESFVATVMYQNFDAYTDELAASIGGSSKEWMDWFLWENDAGKRGFEASPGHGVPLRKIKTLQDLLWLLEWNKTS